MLASYLGALKFGVFNLAWVSIVLWGVERLWPRGERPSMAQVLKAARFWAIYLAIGAAIAVAFEWIKGDAEPIYEIPLADWLEGHWSLYIVGPLAFMTIYDFFNYWMHRAQHKWFWRQHSVHHAIENVSGFNSYFHWTEDLFRIVFISLPMTFVLGLEPGKSAIVATLLTTAHGNFLHSCTRLNLGPIGYAIADNRWHRIHHSREVQHFDRNFGTAVTIWDHLFGTAYVPAKNEWPDTGVHDVPEYETVRDYLWPFSADKAESNLCVDENALRPRLGE